MPEMTPERLAKLKSYQYLLPANADELFSALDAKIAECEKLKQSLDRVYVCVKTEDGYDGDRDITVEVFRHLADAEEFCIKNILYKLVDAKVRGSLEVCAICKERKLCTLCIVSLIPGSPGVIRPVCSDCIK